MPEHPAVLALRSLEERLTTMGRNSQVIAERYCNDKPAKRTTNEGRAEAFNTAASMCNAELQRVVSGSWLIELQAYPRARYHAQIERWPTEVQAQHQLASLTAKRSVRYFHASRIRHVDELATHGLQVRSDQRAGE